MIYFKHTSRDDSTIFISAFPGIGCLRTLYIISYWRYLYHCLFFLCVIHTSVNYVFPGIGCLHKLLCRDVRFSVCLLYLRLTSSVDPRAFAANDKRSVISELCVAACVRIYDTKRRIDKAGGSIGFYRFHIKTRKTLGIEILAGDNAKYVVFLYEI